MRCGQATLVALMIFAGADHSLGATPGAPLSTLSADAWAAPLAAGNQALGAVAHENHLVAIRSGYRVAGDAPPLQFRYSPSKCRLGGGEGDGGSEVGANDGGCWLAAFSAEGADAREWGLVADGVTSADVALSKAVAWATANRSTVLLPPGAIAITGAKTIALDNVSLVCAAGPPVAVASGAGLGGQGTTFWLTSTTVQPFAIGNGVRVQSCNFYWPAQDGAAGQPIPFPPLFTEPVGHPSGNVDLVGDRIVNAYDFIDQASSADAFGNWHITDTYGYAVRYWLSLANVPETFTISGVAADINLFQNPGLFTKTNLARWTAANGAFLHVFGNGDGRDKASTVTVGGMLVSNAGVFGYRRGIWVDRTGGLSESMFDAIWDAVPTALEVDAGGCIAAVKIDGEYYAYQLQQGGTDNDPVFSIRSPASDCTATAIDIKGQLEQAQGDVLVVSGDRIKDVTLSLQGGGPFGQSKAQGVYYFAKIDAPSIIFNATGNLVEGATSDAGHRGFLLTNSYAAQIVANNFNGVYNPVDAAASKGRIAIVGNTSEHTPSQSAVVGLGLPNVAVAANAFDKPDRSSGVAP